MVAMASISMSITGLEQLQKMQDALSPKALAKAQRSAITYAAKAVAPAVAKGIGADYNIKASRIKKDISGVSISSDGLTATIKFSRRPPTLAQFGVKPGKRSPQAGLGRGLGWAKPKRAGKPLTALVIRADGRKPKAGAFLAVGNNGNQLVLRRGSNGKLHGVYGPSIGSIFLGNSRIGSKLRAEVAQRIQEQYVKGFERVLSASARGYEP